MSGMNVANKQLSTTSQLASGMFSNQVSGRRSPPQENGSVSIAVRAVLRTGFALGRYVYGATIADHGALTFTDAAADAVAGVDPRHGEVHVERKRRPAHRLRGEPTFNGQHLPVVSYDPMRLRCPVRTLE